MNKLFLLLILPLIFFACDYQRKSKEDIPQNSTRKSYISIFKSVSIADSLYVYLEDQQRVFYVNVFNPF